MFTFHPRRRHGGEEEHPGGCLGVCDIPEHANMPDHMFGIILYIVYTPTTTGPLLYSGQLNSGIARQSRVNHIM